MPEIDIDTDKVIDAMQMGEIVADTTDEVDTAKVLDVAIEYSKKHDNMGATTRLLEELVAGKLDDSQIHDLKEWDQKLDAAIKLGKVFPQARQQLDNQLSNMSEGKLTLEEVDALIHKTIAAQENMWIFAEHWIPTKQSFTINIVYFKIHL